MISIIDTIEKLKHNTTTAINSIQENKVPSMYPLNYELKDVYYLDNERFEYEDNTLILLASNLPICNNMKRNVFRDSMQNMVDNKEMFPFLLFVNGKFIKWSNIEFVFDHRYKYIVIRNFDMIAYYVPATSSVEMLDIYNNWTRFSHDGTNNRPANATEMASWVYDTIGENILCTVNSTTYIGFVSDKLYDSYIHQVTVAANNTDDDIIGVVVAYYKNTTTGKEYTLSALRCPGNTNGGISVAGQLAEWMIVYNYGQADVKLIANGGASILPANPATGGWASLPLGCTIKIERTEDIINAVTSQFNSNVLEIATELVVNLNSDPLLAVFKGPKAYGYSCISQANSTFKSSSFINKKGSISQSPICEVISLPLKAKYKENITMSESNIIFSFDATGLYTNAITAPTTIVTLNDNVYYESGALIAGKKQSTNSTFKHKISTLRPIIFKNGKLYTSVDNIKHYGLNTFMVDNGLYYANTVYYKLFHYMASNESKDNLLDAKNRAYLTSQIVNSAVIPAYINKMAEPFDFVYDKNLSYTQNTTNALSYIMQYNSALMDDVYKSNSNIVSKIYTGQYIKSIMDSKGYVTMSRRTDSTLENCVIIFVNGELYKAYNQLKYVRKDFIFPVININDTDVIEIITFKNVDNTDRRINISSTDVNSSSFTLDPSIDIANSKLFTMHPENGAYNIDVNENIQYEIPFTFTKLSRGITKITPSNSFYYDKTLSLASSRQFRYALKVITSECISVQLPNYFRFCNDDSKYLVFVNSRKLDKSNYRITTVKDTRPFTNISVYTNITLNVQDRVEVIYVPDDMEEFILTPTLALSGNIVIDKTKLSYNFSKDLYFVFVNGKKINNNQILNIGSSRIKIVTNIKTINNVCIIKHIKDNDILKSLFSNITDKLTQSINGMGAVESDKIYNRDTAIVNSETNIRQNEFDMKSTMYEIVKDYWLKPNINMGDAFVYDYDDTFFTDVDSDGNTIIKVLDANLEDKNSY